MWKQIVISLCLVVVFEGLLPFISPQNFKKSLLQVVQFSDNTLRLIGLLAMAAGVLGLYLVI